MKLSPLAISATEAQEIRLLISHEEQTESGTIGTAIKKTTDELTEVQEKMDRLTRAFLNLEEGIDGDSFHRVKSELVIQKRHLKPKKSGCKKRGSITGSNLLENIISTLETLGNMADAASPHDIAKLLQKIGSNPLLANKTVTFSFGEDYDFLPSLLASVRSAGSERVSNVFRKRHVNLPPEFPSLPNGARERT